MEWGGGLASGGDIRGWDWHGGGSSGSNSCPIGVSADSCPAGAPWLRE